MERLAVEIALLLLSVFMMGGLGGFGLRRWLRAPVVEVKAAEVVVETVAAAPVVICLPPVARKLALPRGLAAPRAGQADELRRISGIGPRVERSLHRLGVFHYDQIARWNAAECEAVSLFLGFAGRVAREQWILQARMLAAEDEAVGVAVLPQRVRLARRPASARRGWR